MHRIQEMLETRDVLQFLTITGTVLAVIVKAVHVSQWPVMSSVLILASISCVCSCMCLFAVPGVAKLLVAAGLKGRDCHRPTSQYAEIAEATGVTVGFTYAIALTIFLPSVLLNSKNFGVEELQELSMFLAALLSVNSMCFLGFADNVLNLRWRHKLTLPTIASLPVLLVYYMQGGSTWVLVPNFLSATAIDFGYMYYVFLSMLTVFGTNAINILAGLNGLEVGQSIVLTVAVIANVLVQMNRHEWDAWQFNDETVFSLYILVPFLCCSVALWIFNRYPARVFVGDTYCYLAGTVLAVAGILGHCSKTVLLFMFPQVLNFVYSLPQLMRMIPCPRHRMPVYVEALDCVDVSFTDWMDETAVSKGMLKIIETFGLAKIERNPKESKLRISNLTVINFVLWKVGRPVNEGQIVNFLLFLQVLWIILAFVLRYFGAGLVYALVD